MESGQTTVSVQRYLDELMHIRSDVRAEAVVRDLLARSVDRLHLICGQLLRKRYPRLTKGPVNLQSEDLLGSVVERMMKAMRNVRPPTVRHFFALANMHLRWELNDLARRLDQKASAVQQLPESIAYRAAQLDESNAGPNLRMIFDAVESLPEEEREAFQLVKLQGLSKSEAAEVIGVSEKTVHRRVMRSILYLTRRLKELGITPESFADAEVA